MSADQMLALGKLAQQLLSDLDALAPYGLVDVANHAQAFQLVLDAFEKVDELCQQENAR